MTNHQTILLVFSFFTQFSVIAQTQTSNSPNPSSSLVKMTPMKDSRLKAKNLEIPDRFKSLIEPKSINLPEGWNAKVFYIGGNNSPMLKKPRFFAFSPDSVLHVANKNSGDIIAFPDKNYDGVADKAIVVATNFKSPHDLAFYKNALYVTEEQKVWKLIDTNQDGIYDLRTVFIDNIASGAKQPGGGHDTRSIAFDEKNKKVYLSIGSLCNVCRENHRGIIEEYNDDGSGRRIYSTGVRNAVGLTIHPRTNRLWATNNGSDNQGNDIPPEWVDLIRDGGFYGYPFAYGHGIFFDFEKGGNDYKRLLPLTPEDSSRVKQMIQPAALLQAHSALMAIEFSNESFLPEFQRGAFVAYRGSWNRNPATGYKVVYLDFDSDSDTTANSVSDFFTGFVTKYDGSRPERWGRPVGLISDYRGRLFVGSDEGTEAIFCIYPNMQPQP